MRIREMGPGLPVFTIYALLWVGIAPLFFLLDTIPLWAACVAAAAYFVLATWVIGLAIYWGFRRARGGGVR